jgi:HEPN domain-containing protein
MDLSRKVHAQGPIGTPRKTSHTMERSADWMDDAEGDLAHAKSDLERGFYSWACFSAQQAAEKAVKAVFQKLGAEAWGHSVADLLAGLKARHEVPESLIGRGLELDKAYIPARYPNAHPAGSARSRYTQEEAARLTEYAEQIVNFCSNLLSSTK